MSSTLNNNPYDLEKYNIQELLQIGNELGLENPGKNKKKIIQSITQAFQEYEDYKKKKLDKYRKIEQLGSKGKEGITFLVVDKKGNEYAMKTFRNYKSSDKLRKEFNIQKKLNKKGICPKVYDYDTVSKYIVMEKMEYHFYDKLIENGGKISKKEQLRFLEIFGILDDCKIFHNDANIYNFMIKNKQIYIIDFGLAKEIDSKLSKTLETNRPNSKLMSIAMILKLKEMNVPFESYRYILDQIPFEDIKKFNLDK